MPEMPKHRSKWRNSLEAQRRHFKPRNFTMPLHVVKARTGQALERKLTADISHPDSSSRLSCGIRTVPDCDGNTIPLHSQLLSFLHSSANRSPSSQEVGAKKCSLHKAASRYEPTTSGAPQPKHSDLPNSRGQAALHAAETKPEGRPGGSRAFD